MENESTSVHKKHMEISAQGVGEQSLATRLLLACGAIGALLNIVVLLILGAIRPSYNAWLMPDSLLELGDGGWMQITNYIVSGVLLLGFAIGLRRVLRTGRGSTWGPILLGIFGFTFIAIGPFVSDPMMGYPPGAPSTTTVQGTIHNLLGQLQFISLIAACFVLRQLEAGGPDERGWAWYSVATGLLVAASDVAFILTVKVLDGGPAGLIERIGIIASGIWVTLLAIRLMRRKEKRS